MGLDDYLQLLGITGAMHPDWEKCLTVRNGAKRIKAIMRARKRLLATWRNRIGQDYTRTVPTERRETGQWPDIPIEK